MTARKYAQQCSVASALDHVGERWALLVIRELMLGPLRFSDLGRAVGGAPTDVLTKRLRDLEQDGIVRRRQLPPPTSTTVYELTELGRELELPLLALGRWGLHFVTVDPEAFSPALLANALRIVLRPPPDAELTVQLESEDETYRVQIEHGQVDAKRGPAEKPDLTLSGAAGDVMLALTTAEADQVGVEVRGGDGAFRALRRMVVLPDRLLAQARAVAP